MIAIAFPIVSALVDAPAVSRIVLGKVFVGTYATKCRYRRDDKCLHVLVAGDGGAQLLELYHRWQKSVHLLVPILEAEWNKRHHDAVAGEVYEKSFGAA